MVKKLQVIYVEKFIHFKKNSTRRKIYIQQLNIFAGDSYALDFLVVFDCKTDATLAVVCSCAAVLIFCPRTNFVDFQKFSQLNSGKIYLCVLKFDQAWTNCGRTLGRF